MADESNVIRFGMVDDHNLFRQGLIRLITLDDAKGRYFAALEAKNGNDLKEKIRKVILPDIIFMDIDMPDMDGYDLTVWMKQYYPVVKILVLSSYYEEEKILKMLRLGVRGYLSKDVEVDEIRHALDMVYSKGYYYSDRVAKILSDAIQTDGPQFRRNETRHDEQKESASPYSLSDNEREFLRFACTELTYQEIAAKMNLSSKTIEGYRDSLSAKLKVRSRVSLALFAVKNGLGEM